MYARNYLASRNWTHSHYYKGSLLNRDIELDFPALVHNPTWSNFQDTDHLNAVAMAFIDVWELSYAARLELAEHFCSPSRTYLRYFKNEHFDIVREAFVSLQGDGNGPPVMATSLDVRYRYGVDKYGDFDPADHCAANPDWDAWLDDKLWTANGPWKAYLTVCPRMFSVRYPSLMHVLKDRCSDIKGRATPEMEVPAATIMHELLHWNQISTRAGLPYIGDFNTDDPGDPVNPNEYPATGYGAYRAYLVCTTLHDGPSMLISYR